MTTTEALTPPTKTPPPSLHEIIRTTPPAPTSQRLVSLDIFRGITIAAMLLVNNPGKGAAFAPLEHADWHGWTPTDLIFPFFLFIVGVAIPFSMSKRGPRKSKLHLIGTIWFRAFSIFLLGALLTALPFSMSPLPDGYNLLRFLRVFTWTYCILAIAMTLFPWKRSTHWRWIIPALGIGLWLLMIAIHYANKDALAAGLPDSFNFGNGALTPYRFRIPGVLQRIGICYGAAATIAVLAGWRACLISAILLCAAYSAVMLKLPYPNHVTGSLTEHDNLARRIDEKVFRAHNYGEYPDPEGLLSTLPAIASPLLGICVGAWLRNNRSPAERCAGLLAAGVLVAILGYCLHSWLMPINKKIWTPSFVVFTTGMGMLGLGTIFWFVDVKSPLEPRSALRRFARGALWTPFRIFGTNAIAAFVAAGIVTRLMLMIPIKKDLLTGRTITLITFCKDQCANGLHALSHQLQSLSPHIPAIDTPGLTSLTYSLGYILVILLIMSLLYVFRVFVKV
ncbi:MAG TPA: DUF5009 domain-containing protein [Tepidisphaeraceae bacterium]